MNIELLNQDFKVLDTKEKITIADSFVVRQNKIGGGNGEAKLYVGNDNQEIRDFFGATGFAVPCFLLKRDLLRYLEETKAEYITPEQPYVNKEQLPNLWNDRKSKIEQLPDKIEFEVVEQTQIAGPRIYVKSSDNAYKLIRELSLPNITYISVVKLLDSQGKLTYYFRLFADYFGGMLNTHTLLKKKKKKLKIFKTVKKRKFLLKLE